VLPRKTLAVRVRLARHHSVSGAPLR
jgi:hypothetical protein